MSTISTSFDLHPATPLPAPPAGAPQARADPRPWGFWGTLSWGLLAVGTGFLAAIAYVVVWILMHHGQVPDSEDAVFSDTTGIVVSLVTIVALVMAIRVRKWPPRDYFALNAVRRRDLVLGIACLAVLIGVFEVLTSWLGIDDGSQSMDASHRAAKLAGVLPLLWLADVVVAPVTEELMFRGFLYRGWISSWLGSFGTIAVTAGLWAMLHQQYDWTGILFIFCLGLMLGWLRRRSGSTTLPIVLHGLNNLLSAILVTIKLEWLS